MYPVKPAAIFGINPGVQQSGNSFLPTRQKCSAFSDISQISPVSNQWRRLHGAPVQQAIRGDITMTNTYYKFSFSEDIPLERVRRLFGLAMIAVEAIHGASAVRLNLSCKIDSKDHSLMVEAESETGYDLAKVLLQFFTKEFGAFFEVFQVEDRRKHSDYIYGLGTILWEPR